MKLKLKAAVRVCTERNIYEWSPQDLEKVVLDSDGERVWFKFVRVVGVHKERQGNVYEVLALRRNQDGLNKLVDYPAYDVVSYMVDFFSTGTHGVAVADGPIAKEEMVTEQDGMQYIMTTNN